MQGIIQLDNKVIVGELNTKTETTVFNGMQVSPLMQCGVTMDASDTCAFGKFSGFFTRELSLDQTQPVILRYNVMLFAGQGIGVNINLVHGENNSRWFRFRSSTAEDAQVLNSITFDVEVDPVYLYSGDYSTVSRILVGMVGEYTPVYLYVRNSSGTYIASTSEPYFENTRNFDMNSAPSTTEFIYDWVISNMNSANTYIVR